MKKKIFLISRPFLGYTSGTGEQYATNTFYATLSKVYQVFIVKAFLNINPYHSIWSFIFYDFINPLIILFTCKIQKIEVVLFCSPYQSIYVRLFRLFKIKTVMVVHDCFFIQYGCRSLFDKYSLFVHKQGIKHSDHVITCTKENQLQIEKYFSRKVDILPLYLDDSFTIDFFDKPYSHTFGYIGKYDNFRKRTFYIQDFIRQTDRPISFSLAGHVSKQFAHEVDLIDNKNVKIDMIGPVSFEKKIDFYKSINFLFFPTDLEGFGLPILEAFRTSTIPIVLEDAQIPDVLKKMCIQIRSVDDIDTIIDRFDADISDYRQIIYENYRYSLQFTENNLLDYLKG